MTETPATADRQIFLGMPGYGKQTAAAGRALWKACADMSQVKVCYQQGSLLAQNFNSLWCAALNHVHEGNRVDYFAMLHDDIGAEDFWLDKLIEEIESRDLDLLGVVVPIKDTRGITSVALQHESDDWRPHARLSMNDVFQLPETFTAEDVGRPLLLNTGCWVCRFDPAWVKRVWFTIQDRIVYDEVMGRYRAQAWSEDWFFSKKCNALGLKIGATRKVGVMHQGELAFTNMKPWGSNLFDTDAVGVSPVPGAFPLEIPGWLRPEEGKALAELARGKRVLEIGSYCGLSTVCMARTAKHVTAVDYFDGRGTPLPQDTLPQFMANIRRYGLAEKVSVWQPDWLHGEIADRFDLVFIDGAHNADSVAADVDKALAVLRSDGRLVFHDYQSDVHPGVTEVVNVLLANGGELMSTHETLAVVKPPALIPLEV
jgi:protein-L-isoaspartate O-methyltransferase